MKRRGFTLIELVVVVALLAILATLVVMGVGKLQTNSKRQQTRLLLQNLQNMFSEFDVNRRVPYGMGNYKGFSGLPLTGTPPSQQDILGAIAMACPQNVDLSYNTNCEQSTMPTNTQPYPAGADRKGLDGNLAVPITRCIMAQLMTSTTNAAAIGKMSSGSLMTFAGFDPLLSTSPPKWAALNTYTISNGNVGGSYSGSVSGTYVQDSSGNVWIRTQIKMDLLGNREADAQADGPPNYYYWTPALPVLTQTVLPSPPGTQGISLSTPVVLDAWGNPIIFVMGGVLGATPGSYTLNPSPAYTPPIGSGGMISGSGSSAIQTQVHSPDYHPFFASAGPDGDFSKGDDNLYSFEK